MKQVDAAIRIAQQCDIPIKIAAKIDAVDSAYFERDIRPLLDSPLVEYIGEINEQEKPLSCQVPWHFCFLLIGQSLSVWS